MPEIWTEASQCIISNDRETNRISDVLNWDIWHVVDVSTVKFAKNGTALDELRSDGEGGRTATLSD